MKNKYVYQITNLVNGKVYIGQTNDIHRRWQEHKHDKRKNKPIHNAIQKYGQDNFKIDILYYGPYYNRVEKNWISLLDSQNPNKGYNITSGGQDSYGEDNPASTITEYTARNIMKDLKETDLSIKEIGEKYNVNPHTVTNINYGLSFGKSWILYPIRINKDSLICMISHNIIKDLKDESLSIEDICEKYDMKRYQILGINNGKHYRDPNEKYPLREMKLPYSKRSEIIKLLKESDFTCKEIGEKVGVSSGIVQRINNGSTWYDDSLNYPIRKTAVK